MIDFLPYYANLKIQWETQENGIIFNLFKLQNRGLGVRVPRDLHGTPVCLRGFFVYSWNFNVIRFVLFFFFFLGIHDLVSSAEQLVNWAWRWRGVLWCADTHGDAVGTYRPAILLICPLLQPCNYYLRQFFIITYKHGKFVATQARDYIRVPEGFFQYITAARRGMVPQE